MDAAGQLLVDLQGLVRTPTVGPLHTDEHIGDVLGSIDVLKLNDEEAVTLVGSAEPERLLGLGVPEVILTLGSQGAWIVTTDVVEHVPAVPVEGPIDPIDFFPAGTSAPTGTPVPDGSCYPRCFAAACD